MTRVQKRYSWLLGIGSVVGLSSWQQPAVVVLDTRAYTLGLVSDYLGRGIVPASSQTRYRIDSFHQDEQPVVDGLKQLLRASQYSFELAPDRRPNCSNCPEFSILTSPRLAAQLNSSYRFRRSGWDDQDHKAYHGTLTKPRLHNERARLSFVAGAYARYGSHQADSFFISLANSTGKYHFLLHSLKQLGQAQVVVTIRPGVPASQRIGFVPTGKLRQYLVAQHPMVDSMQARTARRYH